MLARRTIPKSAQEPAELAYYVCAGPAETTFEQLVAVAGGRWRIEECFQAAKNEAGLASYQVSDYTACYRHITLAMLAHAYLSATRATAKKRGSAAGNGQLIALTVPELRRLLNTLVRAPRPDLDPPPTGPGGADDARLKPAPPTTAPEDSHRHNCRCSTN